MHPDGRYFLLAQISDNKVLIQDPSEKHAQQLDKDDFLQNWSGRLILIARRAELLGGLRRFDFSWFIPAIVKYKRLLGEVLLASFFVQLFALITPLFFQVIIDKVLVHRGMTTLHVLAIGMVVIAFSRYC